MKEIAANALMLIGVALSIAASIGLVRLPDVYNRLHATGKSATLGAVCVVLGAWLAAPAGGASAGAKHLVMLVFLFLTGPVGTHMIFRASYLTGVPLSRSTVRDDLAGRHPRQSPWS